MCRHASAAVQLHDHAQRQAVFPRVQRADPVRERLRQHRDHSVGEIDGGAAAQRFPVQLRALLDIVRYVRDVNAQRVPVWMLRQRNRVVEILRVRTVDRHQLPVPEVSPAFEVTVQHMIRASLRLPQLLLRKFHREVLASGDGENIHPRGVGRPEYLPDRSDRIRMSSSSVIRDLRQYLVSVLRAVPRLVRNQHGPVQLQIVRDHEHHVTVPLRGSDHFVHTAGEDPGDRPGLLSAVYLRKQPDLHRIPIPGAVRAVPADIDIAVLPVLIHGPCETVPAEVRHIDARHDPAG